MSPRDDLVQTIADVIWRIHGPESTDQESAWMDAEDIADVLLAAGWSPPPHTVTTVEEIETLPVGTVLHLYDGGGAVRNSEMNWSIAGSCLSNSCAELAQQVPLTVLYEPAGGDSDE